MLNLLVVIGVADWVCRCWIRFYGVCAASGVLV